jgi:hypothetical protein
MNDSLSSLAVQDGDDAVRCGALQSESVSTRALDVIAERCGVTREDRTILRCLILAAAPEFRANLGEILSGRRPRRDLPDPLALITKRPLLAVLVAVLSDADLLSW